MTDKSTTNSSRIQNYDEFWLFYLGEHSHPATRNMHYLGTTIGLLFLVAALTTLNGYLILGGLLSGYFFAWISHFFVEKNRPATFKYPFWSFYSDFRMYFLFISGGLGAHLQRAGVTPKMTT